MILKADALTDLAGQNKRFGHPRLFVLLEREKKIVVNHKRSERIYQNLGLQIKNRKRKKLGGGRFNVGPITPYGTGDVIAIDFVFDYIENGRKLKTLTIVEEQTKLSPAILVAHSIRGKHLGPFIELACEKLPKVIRVDQGTEFTSRAFLDWAYRKNIQLEFTRVRKPNQLIESFNSRFRDECLNEHLFYDLDDAIEPTLEFRDDDTGGVCQKKRVYANCLTQNVSDCDFPMNGGIAHVNRVLLERRSLLPSG